MKSLGSDANLCKLKVAYGICLPGEDDTLPAAGFFIFPVMDEVCELGTDLSFALTGLCCTRLTLGVEGGS